MASEAHEKHALMPLSSNMWRRATLVGCRAVRPWLPTSPRRCFWRTLSTSDAACLPTARRTRYSTVLRLLQHWHGDVCIGDPSAFAIGTPTVLRCAALRPWLRRAPRSCAYLLLFYIGRQFSAMVFVLFLCLGRLRAASFHYAAPLLDLCSHVGCEVVEALVE